MKILKSTLSIISIIIITIIFVILTPSFWKNQIQDQLNKQLSQRGDWEVKFHKLNGHLLFNVSIDSLYLSNRNSSNVSISKVDMKLNFFKSLFAYPSLKYLKLTDLTTNLYRSSKSIETNSTLLNQPPKPIKIIVLSLTFFICLVFSLSITLTIAFSSSIKICFFPL